MPAQLNKRFWSEVSVRSAQNGYEILLDKRVLKTPVKSRFLLPGEALANAVAEEWRAQEETVAPETMPMTRRANAAIDKITPQRSEVVQHLTDYGGSDLLCYRADTPHELVSRQATAWDPLLEWCAAAYGAELLVTTGIVHQLQPPEALARLAAPVAQMSPFALAGLYDLVTLSGSLVIGLAAASEFLPPQDLWDRSRIDESWQMEVWGGDEEAEAVAERRNMAFLNGYRFYRLTQKMRA